MKKLILSLAALTAFGAAHAQKLGDVFVNGSVGYTHSNSETNNANKTVNGPVENNFGIAPSVGYQFSNNWGAGLALGYDYSQVRSTPSGSLVETKKTSNTFAVGPFLRYTKHISPMFFVNGQLNAMYLTGKTKTEAAGVTTTTGRINGVDVNIMPSVGINITRTMALTGAFGRLGFQTLKDEEPTNASVYTRENVFDATFGREFMLGVQWNFATDGSSRVRRARREPMSETRRMDRYRDADGENEMQDEAPRRRRRSRD